MDSALDLEFRFIVITPRFERNHMADIKALAVSLVGAITEVAVILGQDILDLDIFLW